MDDGDKVTLDLKCLDDPEDVILKLMEIYNRAEADSRGDVLDFVLRMAWNAGVVDGKMIEMLAK